MRFIKGPGLRVKGNGLRNKGMGKEIEKNKPVEREKIVAAQETEEDVILNISLRPSKLKDFIGQKGVVDNLKIWDYAKIDFSDRFKE